jgi:hypothetical protein
MFFAALVLSVAISASDNAPPRALAEASYCKPFGCSWTVTVSVDGRVDVAVHQHAHRSGRYTLSVRQLAELRATLDREAALELSGAFGDLLVDGPVRTISVSSPTRATSFRLYSSPAGFAQGYERDSGAFARALRVCEALRRLARNSGLAGCVDSR